jgi:hypothetical protein
MQLSNLVQWVVIFAQAQNGQGEPSRGGVRFSICDEEPESLQALFFAKRIMIENISRQVVCLRQKKDVKERKGFCMKFSKKKARGAVLTEVSFW